MLAMDPGRVAAAAVDRLALRMSGLAGFRRAKPLQNRTESLFLFLSLSLSINYHFFLPFLPINDEAKRHDHHLEYMFKKEKAGRLGPCLGLVDELTSLTQLSYALLPAPLPRQRRVCGTRGGHLAQERQQPTIVKG